MALKNSEAVTPAGGSCVPRNVLSSPQERKRSSADYDTDAYHLETGIVPKSEGTETNPSIQC